MPESSPRLNDQTEHVDIARVAWALKTSLGRKYRSDGIALNGVTKFGPHIRETRCDDLGIEIVRTPLETWLVEFANEFGGDADLAPAMAQEMVRPTVTTFELIGRGV